MQAMVFSDQEKLDDEAAVQTLPALNQWMKLINRKSACPAALCEIPAGRGLLWHAYICP